MNIQYDCIDDLYFSDAIIYLDLIKDDIIAQRVSLLYDSLVLINIIHNDPSKSNDLVKSIIEQLEPKEDVDTLKTIKQFKQRMGGGR